MKQRNLNTLTGQLALLSIIFLGGCDKTKHIKAFWGEPTKSSLSSPPSWASMDAYKLEPILLRIQEDPSSSPRRPSGIFSRSLSSLWWSSDPPPLKAKSKKFNSLKKDSNKLVEIQFKFYGSSKNLRSFEATEL